MSDVVFDLTEVFSASTGKLRFYGIMRVVEQIGIELVRQQTPVRYGIFSYADQGFLEVTPKISPNGHVDLNVPLGIRELRVRPSYRRKSFWSKAGTRLANPLLQRLNRRSWHSAGVSLPPLDMSDKTLVTAARPKLIVDQMDALTRSGQTGRLVALLHDMIPLHPQFGHKSAYFPGKFLDDNRIVLGQADHILTNSEFTKSEILAFAARNVLQSPPRITAVPLVHECASGDAPPTIDLPKSPYLLTVGATMGRKNLEASFDALLHLQQTGAEVPMLVIAGASRKTTKKHIEHARMAPIRNKIVLHPSPLQEDLVKLYKGALALVMASRMEGWGLPAGEALWWGTPAICSTAPVLQEVCGDLGLYFDPDQPQALAAHIQRLQDDTNFATDLRNRIAAAHPELRTWARVAADLKDVLALA